MEEREIIEKQARLILKKLGKNCGCIVHIGEEKTYSIPICKDRDLHSSIVDNGITGNDISTMIQWMLEQKGYTFGSSLEKETLIDIRNKLCYISEDPERDSVRYRRSKVKSTDSRYFLSENNIIELNPVERALPCEILFNTKIGQGKIDSRKDEIQQIIINSMTGIEENIQKKLFKNIILNGALIDLEGFKMRLIKELSKLTQKQGDSQIINLKLIEIKNKDDKL